MKRVAAIVVIVVVIAGGAGALAAHYRPHHAAQVPGAAQTGAPPTTHRKACTGAAATVSLQTDAGGHTAGSTYTTLVVRNNGKASCTVQGYPTVRLTDSSGQTLGKAAARGPANGNGALMTLAPTGTASASLRFPDPGNFSDGACAGPAANLSVTLPDDTKPLSAPDSSDLWCPGFSVTAFTQSD